jgi:nicotinamidase-related amidase
MLTTKNTVLVIVDVQGKLAQLMADKETMFANLQRMVKGALALDLPILRVEQIPEKLGATIPEVAELLPGLEAISKTCFSCAQNEQFNTALQQLGRKQVLLVGMEAHVCVYQTAMDLLRAGYEVEVVEDAIGSRIASNKGVGVRKMLAHGAGVTSTEMALFELLGTSEHPAFREIQTIIR